MQPFCHIQLATTRLALRPLRMEDAESLLHIYSDPEFTRYWSCEPWIALKQATELIENDLRNHAAGECLRLGVFLRNGEVLIGTCSLFNFVPSCRRSELGYGIAREYWRQGYMFEAVSAVLRLAFEDLGLHRVEADVDPRNTASVRGLKKLGFKREGYLRERWIVGAEVSDSAIYGLLAREWKAGELGTV